MKLDEIEKLIEAASPGPWEYIGRDGGALNCVDVWRSGRVTVERTQSDPVDRANAAFIAASRTLMPKLLKVAAAAKLWLSVADIYSQHRDSADRQVYKLDYMQGREIFRNSLEELEQS